MGEALLESLRDESRQYWAGHEGRLPRIFPSLVACGGIAGENLGGWLLEGSRKELVARRGPGDFDPYLHLASEWVIRLRAKVVVELGVRYGTSTRAFLAGARVTGGHVWGVDPVDRHGIDDPSFTFLAEDAALVADRWPSIDLLHVDTDPHTEEQTALWFELYAPKCRAIALHDTHHPGFGVGTAVRRFAGANPWRAFEYWGNESGWTILVNTTLR